MLILIGTQNSAKQAEHKRVLFSLAKKYNINLNIVFPQDLDITHEPEEAGNTIEENSLQKAKYYFEKSHIPTITDDGSFEIDVLGKAPGVHAKYWADSTGDDKKIILKTLRELKDFTQKKDRSARLALCLTYYDGKRILQETSSVEGYVAHKPIKDTPRGFPYRALFIVGSVNKYYDKLNQKEHSRFNHRENALNKLWPKIISTV